MLQLDRAGISLTCTDRRVQKVKLLWYSVSNPDKMVTLVIIYFLIKHMHDHLICSSFKEDSNEWPYFQLFKDTDKLTVKLPNFQALSAYRLHSACSAQTFALYLEITQFNSRVWIFNFEKAVSNLCVQTDAAVLKTILIMRQYNLQWVIINCFILGMK